MTALDTPLRFYWNGIKDEKGAALQRAYYWMADGKHGRLPEGTITISAKDYRRFSSAVTKQFSVENNSDLMTDLHDKDRIRVDPSHPLYEQVKVAHDAYLARFQRRSEDRLAA